MGEIERGIKDKLKHMENHGTFEGADLEQIWLDPPCIFCGFEGDPSGNYAEYDQIGTHHDSCPWSTVNASKRMNILRHMIAYALVEKFGVMSADDIWADLDFDKFKLKLTPEEVMTKVTYDG